jgi:hypothetical protein
VLPEWSKWFGRELEPRKAVEPLIGQPCERGLMRRPLNRKELECHGLAQQQIVGAVDLRKRSGPKWSPPLRPSAAPKPRSRRSFAEMASRSFRARVPELADSISDLAPASNGAFYAMPTSRQVGSPDIVSMQHNSMERTLGVWKASPEGGGPSGYRRRNNASRNIE